MLAIPTIDSEVRFPQKQQYLLYFFLSQMVVLALQTSSDEKEDDCCDIIDHLAFESEVISNFDMDCRCKLYAP